jgi:hypothetical protein
MIIDQRKNDDDDKRSSRSKHQSNPNQNPNKTQIYGVAAKRKNTVGNQDTGFFKGFNDYNDLLQSVKGGEIDHNT